VGLYRRSKRYRPEQVASTSILDFARREEQEGEMTKAKRPRWAGSLRALRQHEAALKRHPPRKKGKQPRAKSVKKRWTTYAEYLASSWWQGRRKRALKLAGYRCQECGRKARPLHVHHLTYVRVGRERDVDLQVLCPDCHDRKHQVDADANAHLDSIQRQV
jgi:5-methylcytosine-specific restriction endonuclease McrA